jgi:hypothetical protein
MLARLLRRGTLITLLALALAVAGCGSSSRSSQPFARRLPLISIFEAGPQLQVDAAGTLAKLRRLGVDVVKVFVPWERLAPADPGSNAANPAAYAAAAWAPYDTIVREAHARRMGIDLTVNAPPLWAAGKGAPPGAHPQWKPSASAYEQFMRAIATRYSGTYKPSGAAAPLPRVSFWSIWNEPNFGPDLAPQATGHPRVEVSPALYRSLVDAAWSALTATGHGRDTILIGELAPRGQTGGSHPGNFDGMVPLRFLRALYCVDSSLRALRGAAAAERGCPTGSGASAQFTSAHPGLFKATGFADHPYGQGRVPPNVPAAGEPDYADFPAIPRLEQTLDRIMALYGSSKRWPIYSTEFGYQTDPPEKISYAATPKQAAFFDNWAEYLSWRDPRIASYDQYQLIDPPSAGALGGFATGLLFADGTPKATFAAFRLPLFMPVTSAKKGDELEVWGCARPARAVPRPGPVEIQFRAEGAATWSTARSIAITDPSGYFDVLQKFPASGTVRLTWAYPDGQVIHSRKVIISLR